MIWFSCLTQTAALQIHRDRERPFTLAWPHSDVTRGYVLARGEHHLLGMRDSIQVEYCATCDGTGREECEPHFSEHQDGRLVHAERYRDGWYVRCSACLGTGDAPMTEDEPAPNVLDELGLRGLLGVRV